MIQLSYPPIQIFRILLTGCGKRVILELNLPQKYEKTVFSWTVVISVTFEINSYASINNYFMKLFNNEIHENWFRQDESTVHVLHQNFI